MTNAEAERKYFWNLMKERLSKKGNPFTITPRCHASGAPRHYSSIYSGNGASLGVDFLAIDGILRIQLYIDNNLALYEVLKEHKEDIEKILGFPVAYTDGVNNRNVKWIKKEWTFKPFDWEDYRLTLERALPEMTKFVNVMKSFVQN